MLDVFSCFLSFQLIGSFSVQFCFSFVSQYRPLFISLQQKQNYEGIDMPRVKKPTKVKEPVRLRTKKLADGSQSLYLDIYRFGKRTYEYLKLYLIPETDNNARRQNQATMNAANAIKSKRIIELT